MQNSFGALDRIEVQGLTYRYYSLARLSAALGYDFARMPVSIKILLENLLRHENGHTVRREDIAALAHWNAAANTDGEIPFHPVRIVMPDSSGIPLLADLTAMREWIAAMGGNPEGVNPLLPIDMIVDHSVTVDHWGSAHALQRNLEAEYHTNGERYRFLKWAAGAYERFTLFPPGSGIIHQINIEHLARPVRTGAGPDGPLAFPDTLVGLDSHTPMVNGLGVLGWGVGGIEAASAMLGEAMIMPLLPVVGCRFVGAVRPGITSTDVVLTVTEALRAHGVVGAIVEFTGPGLAGLPVADRCTIANMAAEYGATMGFFPIDARTLDYLRGTGREPADIALAEAYARAQGMWGSSDEIAFTSVLEIDLSAVDTSVSGPKRPQQRNGLAEVPESFRAAFPDAARLVAGTDRAMSHGDIAIAAITSCTNTSNPALLMAAGLVARKAAALGLTPKSWVKTSFSPGSPVAARYLADAGLQAPLDALGFQIVGFGCMTCAGQSGPLPAPVAEVISEGGLKVAAVLSSNRNFEGRIHPAISAGYLASPPLVVAYALAGSVLVDLTREPLGLSASGLPIHLADIWPTPEEIDAAVAEFVRPELFTATYAALSGGDAAWRGIEPPDGAGYDWQAQSTYLRRPPYFDDADHTPRAALTDIEGARPLVVLGDGVTTDHISPAGAITASSAAGRYLMDLGVGQGALHSFMARRVNHEVMVRGTFANPKLVNRMCPEERGGLTLHHPSGELMFVHEAAARYRQAGVPMIVVAGRDYGMGSSRDWAAKGPHLLGVRAVIAQGFERIHRSNLIGMGIVPLEFDGAARFEGSETFGVALSKLSTPNQELTCVVRRADGTIETLAVKSRVQTERELEWLRYGGVLSFVGHGLLKNATAAPDGTEGRLTGSP